MFVTCAFVWFKSYLLCKRWCHFFTSEGCCLEWVSLYFRVPVRFHWIFYKYLCETKSFKAFLLKGHVKYINGCILCQVGSTNFNVFENWVSSMVSLRMQSKCVHCLLNGFPNRIYNKISDKRRSGESFHLILSKYRQPISL